MVCPQCKGRFAFEPQQGAVLTDLAFKHAVDAVSAGGHLRWGVEHLYYEVCRRRLHRGLFVGLRKRIWKTVRVDRATFNRMWERWCRVFDRPEGVIVRQPRPRETRSVEPDLPDYSFDRAVICDRARTVDLLLANNFHFENNCAILSIEGYPEGPFETVRAMLKRNPRLHVFALHDSTTTGCQLAHRLAGDPAWFRGQVPVVDVGLRPGQTEPFQGLFLSSVASSVPPGAGIAADEATWLTRYELELAAIRPEQLLRRLFRAINRRFDEDEPDEGIDWNVDGNDERAVIHDSESFSSEAGAFDGGADSFG